MCADGAGHSCNDAHDLCMQSASCWMLIPHTQQGAVQLNQTQFLPCWTGGVSCGAFAVPDAEADLKLRQSAGMK